MPREGDQVGVDRLQILRHLKNATQSNPSQSIEVVFTFWKRLKFLFIGKIMGGVGHGQFFPSRKFLSKSLNEDNQSPRHPPHKSQLIASPFPFHMGNLQVVRPQDLLALLFIPTGQTGLPHLEGFV